VTSSSWGSQALSVDSEGTVHFVWSEVSYSDWIKRIFYKYKPRDDEWSTAEIISEENQDLKHALQLVADIDDTLHLAWVQNAVPFNDEAKINYKTKPKDGLWGNQEEAHLTNVLITNLSLACEEDGSIHLVWEKRISAHTMYQHDDIYYKVFPAGGSWTEEELIKERAGEPSLGVSSDGTLHLGWREQKKSYLYDWDNSGEDYDVYYSFKEKGDVWRKAELVSLESDPDGDLWIGSHEPSLAVEPNGTVHIAWDDVFNFDGCGSDTDIFYKKRFKPKTIEPHEVMLMKKRR